MKTGRCNIAGNIGHVQNEIADLSEERVGRSETSSSRAGSSSEIGTAINQTKPGEVGGRQKGWKTVRVANQLL